jgi:hypothetical protein
MSPEALGYKSSYDGKLNMFSFGHLALFAVNDIATRVSKSIRGTHVL